MYLYEPDKAGYKMRKGNKADFLDTLQNKVSDTWKPLKELPPSALTPVYVIDAMTSVQRFQTLGDSKFNQLQERYKDKIMKMKPMKPKMKPSVSLEDCIEHFVKPELVHDVNCDNCAKNVETKQSKSTFMKQLLFGMFPQCLCILIQRTIWTNTGTPIKLNNHVSFPVILNLGHYKHESFKTSMHLLKSSQLDTNRNSSDVSHNDSAKHENSTTFMWPLLFKLQAVVVHIGHATCGHYITYRNVSVDSKKSRWLYTSDTEVRTASVSEVTQSNAYMLFYEKIK
ncbi:Ubiquitin carboxyl-terminal hydrolase 30 [Nymphon striatum]|nr:Ubiquitin carboxyl-terminal hydrolase 30 [Nymphon striatum]